jgi:hypothetical protein
MKGMKALRITLFVRIWLTVFVALCFLVTLAGATSLLLDSEPGPGERTPTKPPEISKLSPLIGATVTLLSKNGFSIEGPIQVTKVGPSSISLFRGKGKDVEIGLSGKQVSIKGSEDRNMLLSDIKPLDKIYLCRKSNEVVILVLPKKEEKDA